MPDSRAPADSQPGFPAGLRQSRRFQDRPVPQPAIDALLTAGRGDDPSDPQWTLLVIDDLATRTELAEIGAFTAILAQAPAAIVIVSRANVKSSKANDESRVGDRIMLEAGRLGLGSGTGWFGTGAAKARAREILGLSSNQSAWGAVAVGYLEDAPPTGESALDRARRLLDALSPEPPPER
ncbi:MAG TPA: hypothetical protein VD767_02020 [Thermomicrobiales bacterium]|nr:hypothetical protein [Thermomicrobiales bacterium]